MVSKSQWNASFDSFLTSEVVRAGGRNKDVFLILSNNIRGGALERLPFDTFRFRALTFEAWSLLTKRTSESLAGAVTAGVVLFSIGCRTIRLEDDVSSS